MNLKGKRVLITGSAGSIGSELVRQICLKNKVYCLDIDEVQNYDLIEELKGKGHWVHGRTGDVRDKETVEEVFSDFKPHVTFHCAALKVVTPGEWHPLEHIKTNVIGTYNLVAAAKKWPSELVLISSDKAATSTSIYGLTKKMAEVLVRNQGFIAVRFANVLGSRGSIIPLFEGQMGRGEQLTITDARMTRHMMTVQEACGLVIEAAEQGKAGDLFILDTGKKVNILELAKGIIESSGYEPGYRMIGIRPGESLSERLMTEEEKAKAVKLGKFLVIKKNEHV